MSGRFAAPGTLLEAEIWCRLDDLKTAMKRPNDVSVVAMRFDPAGDPAKQMGYVDYFCRNRRPDLELMGSREAEYYAALAEALRPDAGAGVAAGRAGRGGGGVRGGEHHVRGGGRPGARVRGPAGGRLPAAGDRLSLLQESVILAAAATLVAAGLALVLVQGVAVRFTMGAFTLQLDRTALLVGCGAGLGLGVFGAIPPAVRAFRHADPRCAQGGVVFVTDSGGRSR